MAAGQVTECLARWRAGDRDALEQLVPLVYDELRHVARRQLRRESPDHTLSATALVHEVYLRLLRQRQLAASDRDGFLAIAAQTMRRILVDHARARARVKRGGKDRPIALRSRWLLTRLCTFKDAKAPSLVGDKRENQSSRGGHAKR